MPTAPLQLLAQVRSCLGRCRFPVLTTYREGILLARLSRFRLALLRLLEQRRGVDLKAVALFPKPMRFFSSARVEDAWRRARSLGCGKRTGHEALASIWP